MIWTIAIIHRMTNCMFDPDFEGMLRNGFKIRTPRESKVLESIQTATAQIIADYYQCGL